MARAPTKDERPQTRAELREAFKSAVTGEQRFGIREECRPELDQRWERVIALIERLM